MPSASYNWCLVFTSDEIFLHLFAILEKLVQDFSNLVSVDHSVGLAEISQYFPSFSPILVANSSWILLIVKNFPIIGVSGY